ncbi:HNH endonuclease signature motif containing protein, partial [Leifsonia kafniensis]|uniref:HNH endonuclease signature motif containing protein n=1 Tax=Leifsonia kafniensis TaxID=475957 RepID=UPI0031E5B07B
LGGGAPVVMVHVNATDLLDSTGVGWVDGVDAPVSISTVKHLVCAGGMQRIVFAENGEILHSDLKQRFFTRAQRRAIIARDGGCVVFGCTSPPGWAEMHHVVPWYRGGKTTINNGVALCWYHHSTIDTSGWLIRILDGAVQVKAPPWMAPSGDWIPARKHRAHTTLSR